MSRQARICGIHVGSVGVMAVILYLIDRSIAQLDAYEPGADYPVYTEVPDGLSFTCDDKIPGYYADPETMCQVWHWCVPSIGGNIKYSFLCGPGTVFNQRTRVCDWFFKTDCPNAAAYYGVNEDLYKDEQGNYINGKNNRYIKTDLRDVDTDVRDVDMDIRDVDTDVRDIVTEVKDVDTDVRDVDTDVRDVDMDVRNTDVDVRESKSLAKDVNEELMKPGTEIRNGHA